MLQLKGYSEYPSHPPAPPHIREGRKFTKIERKVGGFLPHIGLVMATTVSESVPLGFGSAPGQKYYLSNKTKSKYSFSRDQFSLSLISCRCLFNSSVYFSIVIHNN